MRSTCGFGAVLLGILFLSAPAPVWAIDVQFDPEIRAVELGEIFDYDIFVPASPDTFNAFELTILYEPATLGLLERSPISLQVGPLMSAACPTGFHLFSAVDDTIRITYSLLCAGVRVSGPGVIYRLRFQAPSVAAISDVRILGARFADTGIPIVPATTHDGHVQAGDAWIPVEPVTWGLLKARYRE